MVQWTVIGRCVREQVMVCGQQESVPCRLPLMALLMIDTLNVISRASELQ